MYRNRDKETNAKIYKIQNLIVYIKVHAYISLLYKLMMYLQNCCCQHMSHTLENCFILKMRFCVDYLSGNFISEEFFYR